MSAGTWLGARRQRGLAHVVCRRVARVGGAQRADKTTLVDLIGGKQRPDSGSIQARCLSLTGVPSHRARINVLARTFQHP